VLRSPHVDVVLCGPRNAAQWRDDLAAVEAGPLPEADLTWMREFGRAVHG
jgi:aryl-alcohol dehydrogenase-like predicted oxidoreductase